jgi:hypothetical protein
MALLLSNYTAALKEIVLPYIQDNFPKDKILVDQMKRNAGVTFINDEFIAPVRTSRHGGIASMGNDGNNVNAANGASTSRGTVSVKTHSGAFNISKLAMDASATSKGAVQAALEFQTQTLASDFGRHINRMLYSDGVGAVSMVLGSVSGTEASVTYPTASLDDGRSIDWYGTINNDIAADKYLAVGQLLGVGTGAAAVGTVSALTGTSVQFTGTLTTAANDTLYVVDGSGGGAGTAEIQGLRAALSSTTGTSTYAGLARSVKGWAPAFGSASEALTLSRMEGSYLSAREIGQAGDTYVVLVNKSLFQKYGDILTAMRRTVDKADLLGGFKGLEFAAGDGNVGVFLDYDVPDGEVLIVNLDTWRICQVNDLDWVSGAAGEPLLRLQNTITYQATLVWFANAICLAPGANGRETRKTK